MAETSNELDALRRLAVEWGPTCAEGKLAAFAVEEIERLTRELKVQTAVVDLAYIPHRTLVESRDHAIAERDALQAMVRVKDADFQRMYADREEWANVPMQASDAAGLRQELLDAAGSSDETSKSPAPTIQRVGNAVVGRGSEETRESQLPLIGWRPIEELTDPTLHPGWIGAEPREGGAYAVGEMHWTSDEWYWAGNDPTDAYGAPIYPTHFMTLPGAPMPRSPEKATGEQHG
jgi:hypothetical protein